MGVEERAQVVGCEYEVRLAYSVEYRLTVKAGPDRQNAVEEADLLCMNGPEDPFNWELVHSDVDTVRDIFANDPDAFQAADWLEGPTAPSEETYFDDSRHFETETLVGDEGEADDAVPAGQHTLDEATDGEQDE